MLNLRKSKAKKATFHSYIGDSQVSNMFNFNCNNI